MTSSIVSQDTTIMANGFADSSIRLWNLKGETFKSMTSDFSPEDIKSCPFSSLEVSTLPDVMLNSYEVAKS